MGWALRALVPGLAGLGQRFLAVQFAAESSAGFRVGGCRPKRKMVALRAEFGAFFGLLAWCLGDVPFFALLFKRFSLVSNPFRPFAAQFE
jgi:hypothetical protein